MATLFRRIRQKLIDSRSVTKYLLYAIGEILLVVIGILIALQVNNWNEERKIADLESDLLMEIQSDLRVDSASYRVRIDELSDQLQAAASLKNYMKKGLPYNDSLNYYFATVSFPFRSGVETAGFESLKNAGFLTVGSDSLRKSILNYYDYALFVSSVTDRYDLSLFFRDRIYPAYFKSFSWDKSGAAPSDYGKLMQTDEFYVALDYVLNDARFYRYEYQTLLSLSSELIDKIQNEPKE